MIAQGMARSVARQAGLGRLRSMARDRIQRSRAWVAVPPRRLKDVDAGGVFPANAVALTFDDGPDPHTTPRLLRLLESYSAHATFFMCGLAAQRHPDLVRAVKNQGHSIGGHTWDHTVPMRGRLAETTWRKQVDDTHSLLGDVIGTPIRWFRPPRGVIDRPTWQRLCDQGLATLLWSIDGRDCTLREPEAISERVLSKFAPGQIVLLHDSNANFLFADTYPARGELGNQEATLYATRKILDVGRHQEMAFVSFERVPNWIMPRRGRLRVPTTSGTPG